MEIGNFISPKQLQEIKADIAEAALARANPIVALPFKDGVALVAENPSRSLYKTSEIYDRIAFAGTGVYNDYERLRRHGIQQADLRGFGYSRNDVRAKTIAGEFATILGDIFSSRSVPLEVEILLVELDKDPQTPPIFYNIPFSGGLIEDQGFSVIGDIHLVGRASNRRKKGLLRKFLMEKELSTSQSLADAVKLAVETLESVRENSPIEPSHIEATILDRTRHSHRKFRRLAAKEVREILGGRATIGSTVLPETVAKQNHCDLSGPT